MPTPGQVIHNLKDHTETLLAILRDGKASGGAKERLLDHILHEEQKNQRDIQDAIDAAKTPLDKSQLELALQHSHLLIDMIRGTEIDGELSIELLDHFMEEHHQGFLDLRSEPAPAQDWTIGSLIGSPQP